MSRDIQFVSVSAFRFNEGGGGGNSIPLPLIMSETNGLIVWFVLLPAPLRGMGVGERKEKA